MKTENRLMLSMERLLQEYSYTEITVSMITKETGIARQGFYKFFHDKEDLIRKMFIFFVHRASYLDHEFTLREFIHNDLYEINSHSTFFYKMSLESYNSELFHIMSQNVYEIYTKMLEYRLGHKPDQDMDCLLQAYCTGGIIQTLRVLSSGKEIDVEHYTTLFIDMMPEKIRIILDEGSYPYQILENS